MASIVELAKEAKEHFAANRFKDASRCLREIHKMDPGVRYVQTGDGTIHKMVTDEDGKIKRHPRTEEPVTEEVK